MVTPDRPIIIVNVKGGRVDEILGTTTDVEVIVIDFDELEPDEMECAAREQAANLLGTARYQLY